MSYKLCLGLFLILAVSVLESADDKRQSQDLDLSHKFSRVAREAENSNSTKINEKKEGKKKKERKMKGGKNKKERKMKEGKNKKERKIHAI